MYKMVNFKNYCGSRVKIFQTMVMILKYSIGLLIKKMLKTIIILSIFYYNHILSIRLYSFNHE